jgi:hypothetical protein
MARFCAFRTAKGECVTKNAALRHPVADARRKRGRLFDHHPPAPAPQRPPVLTQPMKLKPGKDATVVRTKDGKSITVHLASREGNDWIVLRPDEGLQYHLSRETARRMFEPNWR